MIIKSRQEINKTITGELRYAADMENGDTGYYPAPYGFVGFNKSMYKYCGQPAYVVRTYHSGKELLLSLDNQMYNWVDAWVQPALIDNREVRHV